MTSARLSIVRTESTWEVIVPEHISSHTTQQLAVAAARTWLEKHEGGELVVHDEHGYTQAKELVPGQIQPVSLRG